MTDITELAQREKFEAWWEREYKHLESSKYTDAVPHIKYGFWMAYQAGGAELVEALEKAKQRIDELENDEVRQRLANAEHQLYMAELAKHNLKASRKAQFRKRKAAERRIAELESRTVTVKLPTPLGWKPPSGRDVVRLDDVKKILTAEGIKWEAE
ncbi:hypothetical protein [Klebsiella sp. CN_Kp109]|uniref:hypothetical protein n=1 Tax=Klebsiella sp. CN_Kp109 TaxID=3153427 RepID=UPI0032B50318